MLVFANIDVMIVHDCIYLSFWGFYLVKQMIHDKEEEHEVYLNLSFSLTPCCCCCRQQQKSREEDDKAASK